LDILSNPQSLRLASDIVSWLSDSRRPTCPVFIMKAFGKLSRLPRLS
jgi:hypothetical protein